MQKKLIISIAILGMLGAAGVIGYFAFSNKNVQVPNVNQDLGEPAVVITRTAAGYEPKEVTIKQGDVVTWINKSGEFHWPASDLHPTHGVYPTFDPLTPIAPGETWSFKFDQVGTWKYHDHIRANKTGTITVTN